MAVLHNYFVCLCRVTACIAVAVKVNQHGSKINKQTAITENQRISLSH